MGGFGLYAAGRWRLWLLLVAGLLLVSGLVSGLADVDQKITGKQQELREAKEDAALHETLAAPRTVLDSTLPAGTAVYWTDEARVEFRSLELPAPTRVFGLLLEGSLEDEHGLTRWSGSLAQDEAVAGWPCRKGDVAFDYDRHLVACVLAADHPAFGFVLPAGTRLNFLPQYNDQSFGLPGDRGMALPALHTQAPASSEFDINHGIPISVRLPEGQALLVRGLSLGGELKWHYPQSDSNQGVDSLMPPADRFDGSLAASFACAGRTFPPQSRVQLSLIDHSATIAAAETNGGQPAPMSITSCLPH